MTPEHKQKIQQALTGKAKTEAHRQAMSAAKIGNQNSGRPCYYLNHYYRSVAEAARKNGISVKTVRRRIQNPAWTSCHHLDPERSQ